MNKTDSIISDYFKHKVYYKEVTITHGPIVFQEVITFTLAWKRTL